MARRKSAKERKAEREQEKRRNQQMWIVGIIVVVAIFAAIIFALRNIPADVSIPDNISRYDNYQTSTTAEGFPSLGNPEAPIQVKEYSSFSCSACANFHETVFDDLLPYIAEGAINFTYVPIAQSGAIPNGQGATRTALCALQQGKFWQMHDTLFSWQGIYGNSAFQDNRLRTGFSELGLDVAQLSSCFNSDQVENTMSAAAEDGFTSTPTVTIDNVEVAIGDVLTTIQERAASLSNLESGLIDDATDEAAEATPEMTAEVTPEADDADLTPEATQDTTEPMSDDAESTPEATQDAN